MLTLAWLLVMLVAALVLAYTNARGIVWTLALGAALAAAWTFALAPAWLVASIAAVVAVLATLLLVPPLRRSIFSAPALRAFRKVLPPMSDTEREALEAGTVWWDGELFSGRPNWRRLLDMPPAVLTPDEQRFLDDEVETLAGMVSDWETTNVYKDLPPAVWKFIKDKGFLGMIIPKAYGGLG